MNHSETSVSAVIIMFLLIITTYTYILLLLSNNKPLFAEVRVLVHGRSSTLKDVIASQNTESNSNRTRVLQKNSLPSYVLQNITALNIIFPALKSGNDNNANIASKPGIGVRIALVEPTFTAAAYNNSFYVFYQKYSHVLANANITSDLNLLSSKVTKYPTIIPTTKVHSAFTMLSLLKNLKFITPDSNITVLTDADVDNGSIFKNDGIDGSFDTNSNAYDVIILGHQEYVTQQDSNVFYAQVRFDRATDTVTLVKGHGWAFDSGSAWKSVSERWAKETSHWVGSNYLCYSCDITFANDPWEYNHHEEQYVTNTNDKILMNYNASLLHYPIPSLRPVIAAYELNYQKGKVISFGIYSDDIITNEKFDKYFDNLVLENTPQKQQQQQSLRS